MIDPKAIAKQDEHVRHITNLFEDHQKRVQDKLTDSVYNYLRLQQSMQRNLMACTPLDWFNYITDRGERAVLSMDVMRESGDFFMEAETYGHKPVLEFENDLIIDGKNLKNPVNYVLLRIKDSKLSDTKDSDITASPVVIIDPRAGHGPGIGGFKRDSEVGVALRAGHPVYFVSFRDRPEPGQTTTHVVEAHAQFLAHVNRAHPKAPKPIVIGNCQGGWAGALVSATHPESIGALVLNGSPLSYWAGRDGQNPMRYLGGMLGGALPVIITTDLSDGTFDGANLVMNFEALNPANTWFRKYKDLFDKVDTEGERFTEFDRWWSGFYIMNGSEIRWILDNLFIGNKLGKGEVVLDNGDRVDLDNIDSPIFVFASWGDNITPPAQALSWVMDVYPNLASLKKSGKRIIYTLHDAIGHLGIFVSKQVAQREHQTISSVIDYAKALPPGLYEMVIEQESSPPVFRFYERNMEDLKRLGAEFSESEEFEIVKNYSELLEKWYDNTTGPALRAVKNSWSGEIQRKLHPMRLRRSLVSSHNPAMLPVKLAAPAIRKRRGERQLVQQISGTKNPIEHVEHKATDFLESCIQSVSMMRDAAFEIIFHQFYGGLANLNGSDRTKTYQHQKHREASLKDYSLYDGLDELRRAVVRIVLLLIKARGGMRGAHLITFRNLLDQDEYFSGLNPNQKEALLSHEASLVVEDAEAALEQLVELLPDVKMRNIALELVEQVVGKAEQLSESPRTMLTRITALLKTNKMKAK